MVSLLIYLTPFLNFLGFSGSFFALSIVFFTTLAVITLLVWWAHTLIKADLL